MTEVNRYSKKYGDPPYRLLLLHGGPGASTYLAPLAEELSRTFGVIETFQRSHSIGGLVGELNAIINEIPDLPVVLLGHSWGAWLAIIYTYHFKINIKKLILVSTPSLEEKMAGDILRTRLDRLDRETSGRLQKLMGSIDTLNGKRKEQAFMEIVSILRQADSFDQIPEGTSNITVSYQQYSSIWKEATALRSSGQLLRQAAKITCPVLAIHGKHDPHPAKGVSIPLSNNIRDFRFILLDKCGHEPWSEAHARELFFNHLRAELII